MKKTLNQELEELNESFKDLFYEICKSLGIIWLVNKMPFLELKDWVKNRDKKQQTLGDAEDWTTNSI